MELVNLKNRSAAGVKFEKLSDREEETDSNDESLSSEFSDTISDSVSESQTEPSMGHSASLLSNSEDLGPNEPEMKENGPFFIFLDTLF